jgi:hypothetical protein
MTEVPTEEYFRIQPCSPPRATKQGLMTGEIGFHWQGGILMIPALAQARRLLGLMGVLRTEKTRTWASRIWKLPKANQALALIDFRVNDCCLVTRRIKQLSQNS